MTCSPIGLSYPVAPGLPGALGKLLTFDGFLRYSRELWNIGKQNSRTLAKLHKPIYKAPGIYSGE